MLIAGQEVVIGRVNPKATTDQIDDISAVTRSGQRAAPLGRRCSLKTCAKASKKVCSRPERSHHDPTDISEMCHQLI
jgi:hypothetical protein